MSAHDAYNPRELDDTLEAARGPLAEPATVVKFRRGHCIYCGGHTTGFACRAHRDLLDLDPVMLARRGKL